MTVVITGYTPTYEGAASRLIQSGKKCGVEVWPFPCADRGSWVKNTRIKPEAILQAMGIHNEPILWIDADAVIQHTFPKEEMRVWEERFDFCGPHTLSNRDRVFYVGTLWFSNSKEGRALLAQWSDWCDRDTAGGDEWLLELARRDVQHAEVPVRYGFMPYRWAWIPECPAVKADSLVVHGISGKAGPYMRSLSQEQRREVGL